MPSPPKKPRKKLKRPFEPGDLVTGLDRSYTRSVYKMLSTTENPEAGLFEFQSLGEDVLQRWIDIGCETRQVQMVRAYKEFRLATRKEIRDSETARVNYMLRKLLLLLNVTHS